MPVTLTFPDLRLPEEWPVLVAPPTRWERESLADLARLHGMDAEFADRGLWHVARTEDRVLEVYAASQSFRLTTRTGDSELDRAAERGLPEDEARARAEDYLRPFLPDAARFAGSRVSEAEVLVSEGPDTEPRRFVTGTQVSVRLSVEDVDLVGPGAKMQVTLGPDGEVTAAYRMWREVTRVGSAPGLDAARLAERLGSSPMFASLTDGTARVEVESVVAGLLCVPPTEHQPVLHPAVAVRGTVSTEAAPGLGFVTYLSAVDPRRLPADKGRPARVPSLVLA